VITLHSNATEVMLLVQRNFHLPKNTYDDGDFQKVVIILIKSVIK